MALAPIEKSSVTLNEADRVTSYDANLDLSALYRPIQLLSYSVWKPKGTVPARPMCQRSPSWVEAKNAGIGNVVPASPPLPPLIGRPSASWAEPENLALKLTAVMSAWK